MWVFSTFSDDICIFIYNLPKHIYYIISIYVYYSILLCIILVYFIIIAENSPSIFFNHGKYAYHRNNVYHGNRYQYIFN